MNITQIILSKTLGGAERHVVELCSQLSKLHNVHVILRRNSWLTTDSGVNKNVKCFFPSNVTVHEVGPILIKLNIRRILRKTNSDIVHVHLGTAAKSVNGISLIPTVATLHGSYKKKCYSNLDCIICVSKLQEDQIPAEFKGNIVTIPNFIPTSTSLCEDSNTLKDTLGISPSCFVVGSVARFDPLKGIDLLIRAFEETNIANSKLVLVGDGPEFNKLVKHASDRIKFVGWQDDPYPYYKIFNLYVCPSLDESFGLTILEAMSCSLPIISTKTKGALSFLNGEISKLIETNNHEQLRDSILELFHDPSLMLKLSVSGEETSNSYRSDKIVPKIEKVYSGLVSSDNSDLCH